MKPLGGPSLARERHAGQRRPAYKEAPLAERDVQGVGFIPSSPNHAHFM